MTALRMFVTAAVVLAAITGFTVPAGADTVSPQFQIKNAHGELCLPAGTDKSFHEAGITLQPITPAKLTTMNGRPCLQITVQGSTNGGATVAGGFVLIRRSSRTELRFTRITGYVKGKTIACTAVVNARPARIEFLTVGLNEVTIRPVLWPPGVQASGPLHISSGAVATLRAAFGVSPIDDGTVLFAASGLVTF